LSPGQPPRRLALPARRLPVRPDLTQLEHQARDLLRAIHAGDPVAVAELEQYHPERITPASARLADAQLRASLRKQLHPGYGEDTLHEYRDVTPFPGARGFMAGCS
jgi:hypothetical protein